LTHAKTRDAAIKLIRNPGFWFIVAVMALITLPYYIESFPYPAFLKHITDQPGLTRHTFERVLYLAPVVWAGFVFGWRGALFVSFAALACMLPRPIIFPLDRPQGFYETGAVFVVGNVLAISFASLKRERDYRKRLENIQEDLRVSEERYRKLFENAQDGIWIHDLEGNYISFNSAAEKMIGYTTEEIFKMNAKDLLSQESLDLAHNIRKKLLHNEPVEQPYEQRVFRKDGREIYIQLSTSLVYDKGKPVGFQNIARDITEQKRMNENTRLYLQQATRAQEEERKRISHELHDDTVQALVVLSRQLDALATNKEVPDKIKERLDDLWKQTDSILQGIRRLSQNLRPAAIDKLGLLPAISSLAADISKDGSVATKVSVYGDERRLPEEEAVALFRVIQEAMNNVRKHSGATRAAIIIEFKPDTVKIIVTDNGRGFDAPQKIGDLTKLGKLGLTGMQERVQSLNGTLHIVSEPGKGTVITLEAPG
jgi:PAS domain S-box-containing protein